MDSRTSIWPRSWRSQGILIVRPLVDCPDVDGYRYSRSETFSWWPRSWRIQGIPVRPLVDDPDSWRVCNGRVGPPEIKSPLYWYCQRYECPTQFNNLYNAWVHSSVHGVMKWTRLAKTVYTRFINDGIFYIPGLISWQSGDILGIQVRAQLSQKTHSYIILSWNTVSLWSPCKQRPLVATPSLGVDLLSL